MKIDRNNQIIGISASNPIDREKVAQLVSQLTGIRLEDFDDPIIQLMNQLINSTIKKGSEAMTSYLGTEWSYVVNEKFMEGDKLTFRPVRYYLTPKQIFTRLKYDMRVIHSDIWVNAFFNSRHYSAVIPVQYPNQADGIIARGGVVIRVNNPNSTAPVSREDSLMDGYTCSYNIDIKDVTVKDGWDDKPILNLLEKIKKSYM